MRNQRDSTSSFFQSAWIAGAHVSILHVEQRILTRSKASDIDSSYFLDSLPHYGFGYLRTGI